MTTLVPILGDQLTVDLASLRGLDPAATRILIAEVHDEATYVRHHKKKIAFLFSAMRHHAQALRAAGWAVDYVTLDDPANSGSLTGEVARAVERHRPSAIRVVEAGEWRVRAMLESWRELFAAQVTILPDDRFFTSQADFERHAAGRKSLTMEYFYRELRASTGILMDDGKPAGGQWNYDKDNRKTPPRGLNYPPPPRTEPDAITNDVLALVRANFGHHFGDLEPFWFAVTRAGAIDALDHFIAFALPSFGDFQDALVTGQEFLYHAVLSPYLNSGLLTPREIIAAAERAYRQGEAPLNAVEGFVRQILGWREYVRGIYWHAGPEYQQRNALGATRPLPDFYWTGETDMFCMAESIGQTKREAYAHHIQRLMVIGNFAMLIGANPQEVSDWYLVVYADAYAWVEEPNVIGMSQYADGGLMGSKPYAGGGNYINTMSDYCGRCRYDVKQRTGPDACPFNALYWDFLDRNQEKLRGNSRLFRTYGSWDRMSDATKSELRASSTAFLATLEPAAPGWARAN